MKMTKECLIVKVPSVFIDQTRYKGINGMNLFMFVFQNPERHIRCFGEVVSTPIWLPDTPILQSSVGLPGYHEHRKFLYKRASDIRLEVQVGDRVYFHYNCLLPDRAGEKLYNHMFIREQEEMENGKKVRYLYYMVKYELVYAAVRYTKANDHCKDFEWWMESELKPFSTTIVDDNGDHYIAPEDGKRFVRGEDMYKKEVVMIGSYVLVEPDKETWEDISLPTPETLNGRPLLDQNGEVKMKPKDQWIVKKKMPEDKYLCGWITEVGSPLKGDDHAMVDRFEDGMYVYFRRYADTKILFEGREVFRMRQRNIVGYNVELSKSKMVTA